MNHDERWAEINADFDLVTDALNRSASVLHGIYEAQAVAEVTPEAMNEAEDSIPKATQALARIKAEMLASDKFLADARDAFAEHALKLEGTMSQVLDLIEPAVGRFTDGEPTTPIGHAYDLGRTIIPKP